MVLPADSILFTALSAEYKAIISPTCTSFCVGWTTVICFCLGNQIKIVVKWLIPILISHFSRTHSVSLSPSKLHWNLFERFFLDVHLAFTCAPASVHLTRKNAYAVVEIEDRNGSLRSPKLPPPPRWIKLANCSCWHYWSLSIGGGMIMLYSELFQEKRGSLGDPKANRSFPFIYLSLNWLSHPYSTCYS